MKLIQLNVWQGRLTRSLVRFLTEQDADIVTLQEVYSSPNTLPSVHLDNFNILEQIMEKIPEYSASVAPLYAFLVADKKVQFSNTILTKLPIIDESHTFTKGKYVDDAANEPIQENTRNAQKVTIECRGTQLTIANMHSHWNIRPDDSEGSLDGMRKTIDFIGKKEGPTIICGDTNVNPTTQTSRLLDVYGTNLTREYGVTSTMTDQAAYLPVAPDQIVVSEEINVLDFQVSNVVVSDHRALILEFEL